MGGPPSRILVEGPSGEVLNSPWTCLWEKKNSPLSICQTQSVPIALTVILLTLRISGTIFLPASCSDLRGAWQLEMEQEGESFPDFLPQGQQPWGMDHSWARKRRLTFFFPLWLEFITHNLAIFKKVASRSPELIGQWPHSAARVPTGYRRLLHEKSYYF